MILFRVVVVVVLMSSTFVLGALGGNCCRVKFSVFVSRVLVL